MQVIHALQSSNLTHPFNPHVLRVLNGKTAVYTCYRFREANSLTNTFKTGIINNNYISDIFFQRWLLYDHACSCIGVDDDDADGGGGGGDDDDVGWVGGGRFLTQGSLISLDLLASC